ncbi:hypothetical protein K7I13_08695 [Brucepastera parasyntrophica]|uniref:hypothetical protein n=1 Tax=Brucepastera parasyntrophica TaxID=2880008 RepID=UPI00210C98FC|nr:hypothetical protein [Brucepastera parasyntrophica]ULQ58638.1 hypothetical protein K7I13_08695 [Brucepastera parasyntrophica]
MENEDVLNEFYLNLSSSEKELYAELAKAAICLGYRPKKISKKLYQYHSAKTKLKRLY